MDINAMLNILLTIAIIVFALLNAFKKMGTTIYDKATFLIAEVAEYDMPGPEKMKNVVDNLYNLVPKAFQRFMTKQRLELIAQGIYDDMKLFAENDAKDTV